MLAQWDNAHLREFQTSGSRIRGILRCMFLGMLGLWIAACRPTPETRYMMDFMNGAPGWFLPQEARFVAQVEGGRLVLSLKPPHMVGWALAPFAFRDGQVEVEGTLLEGPSSTDYGLIVQAYGGRFYRFTISADGYYAVFLYERGSWQTLVDWTANSAIQRGRTTNHLRIRCAGEEITFWINGNEAARIPREEKDVNGQVGVSIGTMQRGEARVAFDRFIAVRER
ncbi:MAG TPA: hypothetical protein VNK89_11355 [Thermoflexus sp.]|nr:hypothetical protein [Thermoflexus sp.]